MVGESGERGGVKKIVWYDLEREKKVKMMGVLDRVSEGDCLLGWGGGGDV